MPVRLVALAVAGEGDGVAGHLARVVVDGAAVAFYDKVLAQDVLMLFPGGMVIDDRARHQQTPVEVQR